MFKYRNYKTISQQINTYVFLSNSYIGSPPTQQSKNFHSKNLGTESFLMICDNHLRIKKYFVIFMRYGKRVKCYRYRCLPDIGCIILEKALKLGL